MAEKTPRKSSRDIKKESRGRFSSVPILVADRDIRTAALVQRVLAAFGFTKSEIVVNGQEAIEKLQEAPFDIVITEWNMDQVTGIDMIKGIRGDKKNKRFRRDIPIIMLTAHGEKDSVEQARDAGVTEFVVKPFSAQTIWNRLIQVIDNPRSFVDAEDYTGPCRRRKTAPPPGMKERRGTRKGAAEITPPNTSLRVKIGGNASDVLAEPDILIAQRELLKSESSFLEWAQEDIRNLEKAYAQLSQKPGDAGAHARLLGAAYAIKSQAGIFGYDLGTEVAKMLVDYLVDNTRLNPTKLTVVRKHIDIIAVIFRENIKASGQELGRELVASLQKLTEKFG